MPKSIPLRKYEWKNHIKPADGNVRLCCVLRPSIASSLGVHCDFLLDTVATDTTVQGSREVSGVVA